MSCTFQIWLSITSSTAIVTVNFHNSDIFQNIYENEELVSVGKGTTVEWKSENQTAVFKIDRADSDRCQFSINGVTFDQLPGDSSESSDPSPPSSTASRLSAQEQRERLSRDALINAVSQWREVRKPNSNSNSNSSNAATSKAQPKQSGALDEALRVQAELQELAGKLARDRDEALRRLQEWQARGGPESSEGDDEDYDQGEEEEENDEEEEEDGDVVEEEFVTGQFTFSTYWSRQSSCSQNLPFPSF